MPAKFAADSISSADFGDVLSRYEKHVPSKLTDLDHLRFDVIPSTLKSRSEDGQAWLEKEELQQLVDWKL
jgi:hypothetical protein